MTSSRNKDFVAIDVETANADRSSICQIGVALYEDGMLSDEWESYIDPQDLFDPINISIHGIDESMVRGSPKLDEVAEDIYRSLDDKVTVCHTHFDRVAIRKGFDKYRIRQPTCAWLDTAMVARLTWEEFARSGYGLSDVCRALGYNFKHHDALEDAKAAGHILLAAMDCSGLDVEEWIIRVGQPIDRQPVSTEEIKREKGKQQQKLRAELNKPYRPTKPVEFSVDAKSYSPKVGERLQLAEIPSIDECVADIYGTILVFASLDGKKTIEKRDEPAIKKKIVRLVHTFDGLDIRVISKANDKHWYESEYKLRVIPVT